MARARTRRGWVLIESEGALFRGPGRTLPVEVWNPGIGWRAYSQAERVRDVEWGEVLDLAGASRLMAWRKGSHNK